MGRGTIGASAKRWTLITCVMVACASAGAAGAPSEVELEYWRSSERLGTVDAYRAYLGAYPGGFFAPLAQAALAKLQAPADAAAKPATEPAGLPLERIAADAPSGAVSFRIGDAFRGPGPLTVGWLGVKKQLVLPAGDWVVLGADDHNSGHTPSVRMTTLLFGRFEGTALKSTLEAVFNSKPGSVHARWSEAEKCATPDPHARFEERGGAFTAQRCTQLYVTKPRPMDQWGGALVTARLNLQRLDAQRDDGRGIFTRVVLTDNRGGFLRIARFDYGAATDGGAIDARIRWAQAYAALAAKGMGKSLPFDDLEAGAKGVERPFPLGD